MDTENGDTICVCKYGFDWFFIVLFQGHMSSDRMDTSTIEEALRRVGEAMELLRLLKVHDA